MIYRYPLTKEQTAELIRQHPTPFHIYDEKGILENARRFIRAFSWVPGGFKNFFAVKALPNPFILKLLRKEGFGADASSLPELVLAEKAGIRGEDVIMTSNDTPPEEFKKAREMGAIINLDDLGHIKTLEQAAGIPEMICFRYNPGAARSGNAIIGNPKEAKYGVTKEQLFEGYRIMKEKGAKRFGLHTMLVSNELDPKYHIETARMLFELVVEVHRKLGIRIEFVNLGGGYGTPYRPDEEPIDVEYVSSEIRKLYESIIEANSLGGLRICMECGRYITGPYGWLVSTVRHVKHTYKDYVGLDSSMANLMRPAIYGAYHHITVLGRENAPSAKKYDVTGSLCENNDKFAIDRMLPEIREGDVLAIHNSGAHGHAMGFNYNGKLRSAELLLRADGSVLEIRRAETADDYFATLDFGSLRKFKP